MVGVVGKEGGGGVQAGSPSFTGNLLEAINAATESVGQLHSMAYLQM